MTLEFDNHSGKSVPNKDEVEGRFIASFPARASSRRSSSSPTNPSSLAKCA
jgi:hypothetical protein